MVYVRVRLRFDSSPLNYAKKCWFVFDADQCSLVKDVAYLIARQFGLTQGIQLYMDDFLIPVNESAHVIRDNDLIRVAAVECDSSNATVMLSEEERSSKVKRRKIEKNETQTNNETSTGNVRAAVASKSGIAKTAKPLAKVGESSKSPGGQLKTVTRKSSSGALHITFQSSSSSESSSESSSTSSSESSESDTTVSKNQRNNAVTSRVSIGKVANIVQKLSPSVKAAPASGNRSPAAGAKGDNVTDVSANRRGRRKRKKSLPTNITVGGDRDVLTTKSTLYKSPVLNNKLPGTSSKLKNSSSNSQSPAGTAADKMKKTTFPIRSTKIAGGKETEKSISQWDVQPTATAAVVGPSLPIAMAVNSAPVSVQQPPAAEQPILHPPQDYSTLPELQGPPRPGDKLAFKELEMSSSYTPVISEYKEATVLGFDPSSKLIQVEYTEETLTKLKHSKERGKPGKFELQVDCEEDEGEPHKSVEI